MLVRTLLAYATALCLALAGFALVDIVDSVQRDQPLGWVPWTLLAGGVWAAVDCLRLMRQLSRKVAEHTRDRWHPRRVELFATHPPAFAAMLALSGIALMLVFGATVGVPNTFRKFPENRTIPFDEMRFSRDADGELQVAFTEKGKAQMREYLTIPRRLTFDRTNTLVLLVMLAVFLVPMWLGLRAFRRDGRPSLVLDEDGLDHAWIGRIPWSRVHGIGLSPHSAGLAGSLALLVDLPEPLVARMPPEARLHHRERIQPDPSIGRIELSLAEFNAHDRRIVNAARTLRRARPEPFFDAWTPGRNLDGLLATRALPEAAAAMPASRVRPLPPPTGPFRLGLGQRLNIAWISLVALAGAAHLAVALLFGDDHGLLWPWLG